jgi:hypothetical protein
VGENSAVAICCSPHTPFYPLQIYPERTKEKKRKSRKYIKKKTAIVKKEKIGPLAKQKGETAMKGN